MKKSNEKKVINILLALAMEESLKQKIRSMFETWFHSNRGFSDVQALRIDEADDVESLYSGVASREYELCIVTEKIGDHNFGLGTVKQFKEAAPELKTLILLDVKKKSGKKCYGFYENGYYDAIFMDSTFGPNLIKEVFLNSRTKEEAYKCYGIANYKPEGVARKEEAAPAPSSVYEPIFTQSEENVQVSEKKSTGETIAAWANLTNDKQEETPKPNNDTNDASVEHASMFRFEPKEETPTVPVEPSLNNEIFSGVNKQATVEKSEDIIPDDRALFENDTQEQDESLTILDLDEPAKETAPYREKESEYDPFSMQQDVYEEDGDEDGATYEDDADETPEEPGTQLAGNGNVTAYRVRVATVINDNTIIIDNPLGGFKNLKPNAQVVMLFN